MFSSLVEDGAGHEISKRACCSIVCRSRVGSGYRVFAEWQFETGDFTGWTLTDPSGSTSVEPTTFGYGAQSGNFYVYAGPPSSAPGILSQTFFDTAGEQLKCRAGRSATRSISQTISVTPPIISMTFCWGHRICPAEMDRVDISGCRHGIGYVLD